ncbi:MAG: MCE family protein [Acidimicrobiales bacterium]
MIALGLVIVLGVYYIAFDVMQYRIGAQPYTATVMMTSAGGLYTGANVTYRGVQVGSVSALDLHKNDVAAKISLYPGTRVPDNGTVYVKELSALGEQYLDLQPSSPGGPFITSGTVIPASRVVLPIPIGTTLVDLGAMLKSLNPSDLHTVEAWLSTAFGSAGPGLKSIVASGQKLFEALAAAQPETVNLIVDGSTDLKTLQATDGDLAVFAKSLASLTGELKSSNSDLRDLIDNGASLSQQLNPFLQANSTQVAALIASLSTDAKVSDEYQPEVRAIFELLPIVSDDLASVASGGRIHGVLEINTANTVCPYVLGSQMPGPTQKVAAPTLSSSCSSSAPDMLQRGAGT